MSRSSRMLHIMCRRLISQRKAVPQSISSSYDVSVGVALYRAPLMAPAMSETEKNFLIASSEIEVEKSLKCNFELKMDRDAVLLSKRKKLEEEGKDLSQLDEQIGLSSHQQIDEWKKNCMEKLEKFGINRIGFHKCSLPTTSFNRKQDRKLVLLVREKFLSSDYASPWILPQLKNNGEPLRQTAERCAADLFRDSVNFRIFGNAPFAHYKYRYPKIIAERTGSNGNIIFFYAAEILSKVSLADINDERISRHQWCTPDEVRDLIASHKYRKRFDAILVE